MDKSAPHCKLPVVKALIEAGKVRRTYAAEAGAAHLGLRFSDMIEIIKALTPADFYKSMTTHANHRAWQDIYHTRTAMGDEVYLKRTVIDDVLVVSFKEL
ncbi:MAG: type II toxin-antitoxin system MqsR family toxin [Azoarcus sp.]|jgi:motility quorum-sensing regulator/GCU-specific mRNA interferase toxin|nr:type II toxin-antitoxin system MqsR family toxin [Azoarcus sp.]